MTNDVQAIAATLPALLSVLPRVLVSVSLVVVDRVLVAARLDLAWKAGRLARATLPPPASESPYAADNQKLPSSLNEGLDALRADSSLCAALGEDFVRYFCRIKQSEIDRHAQAEDKTDFERREYFART